LLFHPTLEGINHELTTRDEGRAEGGLHRGQAEQIGGHPYLSIAGRAGSDADHRNRQHRLDLGGQLRRHMLQHQGETARTLKRLGLTQQLLLATGILRLLAVAQTMHRLRGQPQMPHHRDPHADEAIDHRHDLRFSPLQLHGGGTGVFE